MSHKREFFDLQQAHSYLTNSVIRLDGEPIYVLEVSSPSYKKWNNNFVLVYQIVGNDHKRETVEYQHDKLDLSPVPLGLVNWPASKYGDSIGSVLWAARMPRRGWKIGLSSGSLFLSGDPAVYRHLEKGHFLLSSPFRQTVVRNFPSYKKIVGKEWKDGVKRIAFSSRFYLTKKGAVGYKNHPVPVGTWKTDGGITLHDEYQYLLEVLEEDMQ